MTRRALIAALASLVALTGCGGSGGDGGEGNESTPAAAAGIELRAPAGWTISQDGLTAAERKADLTAAVPEGPRVRTRVSASTPNLEDAAADERDGPAVVDGPEQITIDGRDALRITLREVGSAERDEGVTVRRYVAAKSPTGEPVLFVLEAPEGEFDANEDKLGDVPGWT